jgi:hypothetical protein
MENLLKYPERRVFLHNATHTPNVPASRHHPRFVIKSTESLRRTNRVFRRTRIRHIVRLMTQVGHVIATERR